MNYLSQSKLSLQLSVWSRFHRNNFQAPFHIQQFSVDTHLGWPQFEALWIKLLCVFCFSFFGRHMYSFLLDIPPCGIAGSLGNPTVLGIVNSFQHNHITLHFHHQYIWVPLAWTTHGLNSVFNVGRSDKCVVVFHCEFIWLLMTFSTLLYVLWLLAIFFCVLSRSLVSSFFFPCCIDLAF